MNGAAVIIPWRPGCPHREAALEWVCGRWRGLGLDPILGVHDGAEWCKASAVANGLAETTADTVIVADGDVWCDGITEALQAADTATWVIPHKLVHRLTQDATADVLAGAAPDLKRTEQRPYSGQPAGGIVILRRATYDDVPLDAQFVGWGQEDQSWDLALRTLAGRPVRFTAPLIHLWHPPQPRLTRSRGSAASRDRYTRYQRARNKPAAMRALVEEGRTWTSVDSST